MPTRPIKRRVKLPYPVETDSKALLNPWKAFFIILPITLARLSSWSACGLKSTAQSDGLSVSETKQEITVEAAIVTANCLKKRPEIPEMKAEGTKTAHNVRGIAREAPPTSYMVRCAASLGDMPSRILRSTFSTTTIASSTTMPTASTNPNRDRLLIEIPRAARMLNVPISETGIATTGMMVARHV